VDRTELDAIETTPVGTPAATTTAGSAAMTTAPPGPHQATEPIAANSSQPDPIGKKLPRDVAFFVLGVLVTLATTLGWDLHKSAVETRERRARILTSLANETVQNQLWIRYDLAQIAQNRRDQYKLMVQYGMSYPSLDAWRQLDASMGPDAFDKRDDFLGVAGLYMMLAHLQDQIRSREAQRVHREGSDIYVTRMRYVDDELETELTAGIGMLDATYTALENGYLKPLGLTVFPLPPSQPPHAITSPSQSQR
jgi:hypothetical protein